MEPFAKCRLLSMILLAVLALVQPSLAQTATQKPDSRSNSTENLPQWSMSDEEFNTLLLQVETILPIYESTLKDVDAYMSGQQGLSYQEGEIFQYDLKMCRTDLANIRRAISSLKDFRWVMTEIDLRSELLELGRDTAELQQDELNAPLTEMNPRIRFPNPTGFDASNKELTMPIMKLGWDYVSRIKYLESKYIDYLKLRTSKCSTKH